MDALRGIAMWLGVVLHAVMAYQIDPRGGWPKDMMSSPIMDWIYHYLHSFRMPIFFLVAGFFADFLNRKIGLTAFLRHRYKRIVLPFFLSVLVIVPICGLVFSFYRNLNEITNSIFFDHILKGAAHWTGFYHIWFLYYLILIYILYLAFKYLMEYLKVKSLKLTEMKYFITVIFLIGIQYLFFSGQVEPWTGLIPKPGQLLYFGYFFALGVIINKSHDFLFQYKYLRYSYLVFGLVILYFTHTYEDAMNYELYSVLISIQTALLVLGNMAVFMNLFNRESAFLRYFSDSSYWFYLIHFPIVVLLQILMINMEINLWFKFSFIITFTTLFSLITYHYFVRYTWVGTLLNGKRDRNNSIIKQQKVNTV